MKNTKRISILSALALGLVIAAGAFVMPAVSYANEDGEHKDGEHKDGEHDEHGHGDKH